MPSSESGAGAFKCFNGLRAWCKRVYDPPEASNGRRVLLDRVWPRALTNEHASLDVWLKDIAPSASLRI